MFELRLFCSSAKASGANKAVKTQIVLDNEVIRLETGEAIMEEPRAKETKQANTITAIGVLQVKANDFLH